MGSWQNTGRGRNAIIKHTSESPAIFKHEEVQEVIKAGAG